MCSLAVAATTYAPQPQLHSNAEPDQGCVPWHCHEKEDGNGSEGGSISTSANSLAEDWPIERLSSDSSSCTWSVRNTFLRLPEEGDTPFQSFQRGRRAWSVPVRGREADEREAFMKPPAEMRARAKTDTCAMASIAVGEGSTPGCSTPSSQNQEAIVAQPAEPSMQLVSTTFGEAWQFGYGFAHPLFEAGARQVILQPFQGGPPTLPSFPSLLPSQPLAFVSQKQPVAPPMQQEAPRTPVYSKGAALHHKGKCKPCAFFGKDEAGCQNGADCSFCHLCGADERKRRSKEKQRKYRRKQRMLEKQQGEGAEVSAEVHVSEE